MQTIACYESYSFRNAEGGLSQQPLAFERRRRQHAAGGPAQSGVAALRVVEALDVVEDLDTASTPTKATRLAGSDPRCVAMFARESPTPAPPPPPPPRASPSATYRIPLAAASCHESRSLMMPGD